MSSYLFLGVYGLVCVLSCTQRGEISRSKTGLKAVSQDSLVMPPLSSNTNAKKIHFDSTYRVRTNLSATRYNETVAFIYGAYKVEVESFYLKDSVSLGQSNLFNPACLHQELRFYKNGKLDKTHQDFGRTITQLVSSQALVEMLEVVITDVGLIKGQKGLVVAVSGWGGCDSCPEFYGLFSLEGNRLWSIYQTKYKLYYEKGSYKKTVSVYGIDAEEFSKQTYSKVDVY